MFSRSIYRAVRSAQTRTSPVLHIQCLPRPLPRSITRQLYQRPHSARLYSSFSQPKGGFGRNVRTLFRVYPFSMAIASAGILFGMSCMLYILHFYYYAIDPINTKFPEPVANKLRRALWFTNIEPAPQKALDCYQEAIKLAQQHGMHPFSAEVLGIKIKVAALLEQFKEIGQAIEVYDIIRRECQEFLDMKGDELHPSERMQILAMVIKTSVKIGELYGSDAIQDTPAAEKNLTQAVEIILKEEQRRKEQRARADTEEPENNDDWLAGQEVGAAFEQLANHFESESKHYLAAPLYMRALMLSPSGTCRSAVLMNNLGMSIAQQKPDGGTDYAATRETLIENGKAWAHKALQTAHVVYRIERVKPCAEACAVAGYNLGEFAVMQQRYDEAEKHYINAEKFAKYHEFEDVLKRIQEARQRLEKLKTG